jgi:hypothetical protein
MTALGNLVNSHPTMADELPLIHTSLSEHLKSFASSHALQPSHCTVFDESLIYLFYGRPAYRSNRGSNYGDADTLRAVAPQQHIVGAMGLHAFEFLNGQVKVAIHENLAKALTEELPKLRAHPFVLHDAAEFIGDASVQKEARQMCNTIIQEAKASGLPSPDYFSHSYTPRIIKWENDLVERPFCEQLKVMGWQWLTIRGRNLLNAVSHVETGCSCISKRVGV